MARQNAIGIRIEEGSNSNGRWLRVGGTLQQFGTITLTFVSANFLQATWTFPLAFSGSAESVRAFPVLRNGMAGASPNTAQIGGLFNQTNPSTTQAIIRVSRVTGQTDFVSGDTVVVDVMAVGPAPS